MARLERTPIFNARLPMKVIVSMTGVSIKGTTKSVPGKINNPISLEGVTIYPGKQFVTPAEKLRPVPPHPLGR